MKKRKVGDAFDFNPSGLLVLEPPFSTTTAENLQGFVSTIFVHSDEEVLHNSSRKQSNSGELLYIRASPDGGCHGKYCSIMCQFLLLYLICTLLNCIWGQIIYMQFEHMVNGLYL